MNDIRQYIESVFNEHKLRGNHDLLKMNIRRCWGMLENCVEVLLMTATNLKQNTINLTLERY